MLFCLKSHTCGFEKIHTYVEYVNKRKIDVFFPLALFVYLKAPLPLFEVMQSYLNICRSWCICNKLKDAVGVRKKEKVFVCVCVCVV